MSYQIIGGQMTISQKLEIIIILTRLFVRKTNNIGFVYGSGHHSYIVLYPTNNGTH